MDQIRSNITQASEAFRSTLFSFINKQLTLILLFFCFAFRQLNPHARHAAAYHAQSSRRRARLGRTGRNAQPDGAGGDQKISRQAHGSAI